MKIIYVIKVLAKTNIPHHYKGVSGAKLPVPCTGFLQVILYKGNVYTHCPVCGDGYSFDFVPGHSK